MVINSPTNNDSTDNLTSHSQCLLVVFLFDAAIQQNWNNKPNAEAYDDGYNHLFFVCLWTGDHKVTCP